MTPEDKARIRELRTLIDSADDAESASILASELGELLELEFKELNDGNQNEGVEP